MALRQPRKELLGTLPYEAPAQVGYYYEIEIFHVATPYIVTDSLRTSYAAASEHDSRNNCEERNEPRTYTYKERHRGTPEDWCLLPSAWCGGITAVSALVLSPCSP